ncbi:MAG: ATP-binding cassette domain-containing protein [Spirochaetaceae bacterium]|nr:ATP-binding cassette domain-containing protein [Spirochaetaceae bacterium]
MKNESLFSLEDLLFSYNGKPVINIKKLEIPYNKVVVLQGPNGCGKTTLLKLLNCLLMPSSGFILHNGVKITKEKIRNKSIYLHQEPYLFSGTVEKNLTMVLKIKRVDNHSRKAEIREVLRQTGLENFEKRKCHQLSGGEKKRVALARALLAKPEILLLDEPDANIDAESALLLEGNISRLKNDGISIIMSTHSRQFAYRNGDFFLKMNNGMSESFEDNIYRGTYNHHEGHYGSFRSGELIMAVPGLDGNFRTARISPDEIILSEQRIETSAQNQLEGKVQTFTKKGSLYSILLKTPEPFISHITEESFISLRIVERRKLFLIFKASSVKLY